MLSVSCFYVKIFNLEAAGELQRTCFNLILHERKCHIYRLHSPLNGYSFLSPLLNYAVSKDERSMPIWSLSIDLPTNIMFILLDMDHDLWNIPNKTLLMDPLVCPGHFAACHWYIKRAMTDIFIAQLKAWIQVCVPLQGPHVVRSDQLKLPVTFKH